MRRLRSLAVTLVLVGCAHGPASFDPRARPTCLVLSVGGADGVAHLGAIAAVRARHLPISCVVGTSMGALVGALYASAPALDTEARFHELVHSYARATEASAHRQGTALALMFGLAARALTDNRLIPPLAAGGGYLLGLGTTDKLDRDRLVHVMDDFFARATIEGLPLPYATLYQRRAGDGVELVTVRSGDLAEAVGASVANPFLFPKLDVARAAALDPGADRVAATPVEDACRMFPDANLLAINVTGQPAFYSARMTCPLREVMVARSGLPPEDVLGLGPAYARAVSAGYQATWAALAP